MIFVFQVSAQNIIQGIVTDENNHPLVGASVTIKQTSKTVFSNQKGEFSFTDLSDFAYTILVKYMGYETFEKNIQTGKNTVIQLKHTETTLEEVTVFATRANEKSPIAYTNVDKNSIKKLNDGQDLPYLLAHTPSFITTSDAGTGIGYTGFRIRGTDANRTNVTINGIPYNDSESHTVYFVDLPDFASSLQSIQVQRGVGTSSNGAGAFGASINLQTETLRPSSYAEIGTSVGSFGTYKNTLKAGTGLINKFAVDVRISSLISDGFINRASVNMKSYYLSAGFYNEKTLLKFITFGGKEKSYQAWNGVDLDLVKNEPEKYTRTYNELGTYTDENGDTKFYDNQVDNYGQYNYQLLLTQVLYPSLTFNGALHYTRGNGYYEEYKQNKKFIEYGLKPTIDDGTTLSKTDLIRQKWLDNHFGGATFSLNYDKKKYSLILGGAANKYFGDHFGRVIWARYSNNLLPNHQYYFNTGTKTDINIYIRSNFEITNKLIAYADLQYRYILQIMSGEDDKRYDENNGARPNINQVHPFHFFNPKVGLNYQINDKNSVFALFAVANREPNRNNYTDALTNENPTSERLYDTELGYKFQSKRLSLNANAYYMNYKSQLILTGRVNEIGEPLTTNIPYSYRAGLEFSAGLKLFKEFRWDGNLNLSQNKIKNFTEFVDEYDADWNWIGTKENYFSSTNISYSPNIVANSVLSYALKNFDISFYSTFIGKQYLDNTSNITRSIEEYFVNNIRLGYTWELKSLKSIDLNVLINNIFNAEYETNGYNWYTYYLDGKRTNEKRYFPQAGRNFLCSVTVKL